ncbi:O-acyltransferase WSD1 [Herrania umbratica]|uniref:O-acyltransferase WSD1 n=1 Tax=Herrania umbratica TaxID=108875 RepID=A0A6J1BDM9_9ROSI|nr:O-acyltransferase WSD1 [Herrania umbratica]
MNSTEIQELDQVEAKIGTDMATPVSKDEVPLSPGSLIFLEPGINCCVIAILGWKSKPDPAVIKEGLKQTLIKHPCFSSKLMMKSGKKRWIQTQVNVDNHVILPEVDTEMESPSQFIEDYVSYLTRIPLDLSKPLWELHLVNLKTPEAEAVGIFRIHHSIGDGMSLISLLLASCRKSSDPEALPTIPKQKQADSRHPRPHGFFRLFLAIWSVLRLILNTIVDLLLFVATVVFLKDTKTPLKGSSGVEQNPKKIVHRTVSLDDIKLVKNAMGMTVNDVIMGVTQAGLSRYLNRKYGEVDRGKGAEQKSNHLPRNICLRATSLVNIRQTGGIQALADMMNKKSKVKWGNQIGYICIPFTIALRNDPLDYLRGAKAAGDRKKQSLEAICTHLTNKCVVKLFGSKLSAALVYRVVFNTTMTLSNVAGPVEEISFYGHPIAFIAPSVYGHPQALTCHFQSYVNKMSIVLAVDPNVIPDPHLLCDDLEESLKIFKDAVVLAKDAS